MPNLAIPHTQYMTYITIKEGNNKLILLKYATKAACPNIVSWAIDSINPIRRILPAKVATFPGIEEFSPG